MGTKKSFRKKIKTMRIPLEMMLASATAIGLNHVNLDAEMRMPLDLAAKVSENYDGKYAEIKSELLGFS